MKIGRRGRYRPVNRRLKVRVGRIWRKPKIYGGRLRVYYRRKRRLLRITKRRVRLRFGRVWKKIKTRRYGRRYTRRRRLRRRKRRQRRRRRRRRRKRRTRRRRRRRRQRRRLRRRRRKRRRRTRCVLRIRYRRRLRPVYRRRGRLVMRVLRKFVRVRYVGYSTNREINHQGNCAPFIKSTVVLLKARLCFIREFHQFAIWVERRLSEWPSLTHRIYPYLSVQHFVQIPFVSSANLKFVWTCVFCYPPICLDILFL